MVLISANVAAKLLAIALALYPLYVPDRPQFRGKAMRARAVVYPLLPFAIPLTWLWRGRPTPYRTRWI